MLGKAFNMKYASRQVGDNLHEMSNPIFMDNRNYQIVIYSVCPESAED